MKIVLLPAVVMATMLMSTGFAYAGDSDKGRELYELGCQSCHGASGTGDGPYAKKLESKPADLTVIARDNGGVFPDAEIRKVIDGRQDVAGHGDRKMPVWGEHFKVSVNPKEKNAELEKKASAKIGALVDFLKSIQKP